MTDSTFAVSTIPLAPSITKLENDCYNLIKPNMTEDIIELNDLIMNLNAEPGQKIDAGRAPRFHTWGLCSTRAPKTVGPRNLLETLRSHAQLDWRESRPANQLHLNDNVRLRMGKATIKYFLAIYGIVN